RLQITRSARSIGCIGRCQGMLRRLDDIGVERPPFLHRRNPGLGGLAGGEGPRLHAIAERGDAKFGQVAHYSITFGTAKKPCSATGALARISSRRSGSVTTSSRRRSVLGMTAVIGATPSTFTSPSCSTQPRMLESSGASFRTSASLTAMRASFATWRTVASSTDMAARLAFLLHCGKVTQGKPIWSGARIASMVADMSANRRTSPTGLRRFLDLEQQRDWLLGGTILPDAEERPESLELRFRYLARYEKLL